MVKAEKSQNDMKSDLNQLLSEINDCFKKIFVSGISSISETTIKDLQAFETRLNELGAENLAYFLNQFIKKSNQLKQNRTTALIIELSEITIKILTYKRVFERVTTHEMIKQQINQMIIGESVPPDDEATSDSIDFTNDSNRMIL
jgi:hypothetical protein